MAVNQTGYFNLTYCLPFKFEEKFYNYLKSESRLEGIQKKKKVFRETQKTSDIKNLLKEYYLESTKTGAILFLVVEALVKRMLNNDIIKFSNGFAR